MNYNKRTEEQTKPDLLLQYTDERSKYNYTEPTSIRVLSKKVAKEIFGFEPTHVNYNYIPSKEFDKFIPLYYVPYNEK